MAWPTTSDPKTEFVTVRFTASEDADIVNAATARGMKRSAYVREAVRRMVAADAKKARTGKSGKSVKNSTP